MFIFTDKKYNSKRMRSKYPYRCVYFYGIKCVEKDESDESCEIDLKEPIIRFVE